MDLKEIMSQQTFAVLGDTLSEEKYAYKIKNGLIDKGYTAFGVGKELKSLNDIEGDIDVIDMCINPVKALKLLKECEKDVKAVVVQPGAGSDELESYMNEKGITHIDGCLLVGLSLFAK